MNNVIINRSESIFEPFWDSGESYPGHHKFSRLSNYKTSVSDDAVASADVNWCSVLLNIEKSGNGDFDVKIERDCVLDISNYDTFILFGKIDASATITVHCVIDGVETKVLSQTGTAKVIKYKGEISGKVITHIVISLKSNSSEKSVYSMLYWLGLGKAGVPEEEKSIYSPEWEGCFNDEFEIKPSCNIFFNSEELVELRKKIETEPFKSIYQRVKDAIPKYLSKAPEEDIGRFYVGAGNGQFGVYPEDENVADLVTGMQHLAFCGIIEEDAALLKMACRYALSVSHFEYWCEHIMGVMPGITWHHRSFTEFKTAQACALVLDWAGSLLTWHGKNIIYDAIIMKGLPRIEADLKTMDYIYECNQGFMFNCGRVAALLALKERYPRYISDIEESEKFMFEMIEKSIYEDGGYLEGPGYWAATVQCVAPTLFMLSRYKNIPLDEYAPEKLKTFLDYGLLFRSDWGEHMRFIPVSDTLGGSFSETHTNAFTFATGAIFSKNPQWQEIYNSDKNPYVRYSFIEYLLMAPPLKETTPGFSFDGFMTLNKTGVTTVRKTTEDVGAVHFVALGGTACFSHSHDDKGSFILEVNNIPVFIDGGSCGYADTQTQFLHSASAHNLFLPELPLGETLRQISSDSAGGKVLEASYEKGIFKYETDLVGAWDTDILTKSRRRIISEEIHTFIIEDVLESTTPLKANFLLNTHGEIKEQGDSWTITNENIVVTVTPLDYKPSAAIKNLGYSGFQNEDLSFMPLKQLCLALQEKTNHNVKTRITISCKEN